MDRGWIIAVGTVIYFVRHADSPYVEGQERSRGLSERGMKDALSVRNILVDEGIDVCISSPYERAIRTIRPTADSCGMEVIVEEDLRERKIGDFAPSSFLEAKQRVYDDFNYSFPNGESSYDAQSRALTTLKQIIKNYYNKKVVIGTHGDIMTLMLNGLNQYYGYEFWQSTSMPDIYKVYLNDLEIVELKRLLRE